MSKSRRDLSLVAIAALVASSFAMAAPAQAAGELKIEPVSGSGFAVPHLDVFSLKVSATGGNDSAELDNLKYLIETDGATSVFAITDSSARADVTGNEIVANDEDDGLVLSGFNSSTDLVNSLSIAVRDGATEFDGTDSTKRVTITAFVDKNSNGLPDAGDEWTAVQEVTFYDWDDIEFTNVLKQPILGGSTVETIISDANINLTQSSLVADFSESGTVNTQLVHSDSATRTYTASRDELGFSTDGFTTVGANTYTSRIYWSSDNSTTDSANRLGVASNRTVGAATVDEITGTALRTDESEAIAADAPDAKVKSGDGSFTYVASVATNSSPREDKTVTLTVSETTNRSLDEGTVTVGGETLSNADNTDLDTISVTGVTDAEGEVSFSISYADLEDGDVFAIQIAVDDITEDSVTLTAEDSAVTQVVSADVIANDEQLVVATDEAFTLTYHVLDQFGALYSGTDATVTVTENKGSNDYTGSVVNGAASIAMPSFDEDLDGAIQMTADVATTGGGDSTTSFVHTVFVGSANAPTTATISGAYGTSTNKTPLNVAKTSAADARFGQYTLTPTLAGQIAATATITDANGNGTRSQVTFSGTDLMFQSESHATGPVVRAGSITVWTDANGVADVSVSSQRAGAKVMTVTAGGVSSTKDIVFAEAGDTAGVELDLDVPTTATPGSTFQVTGTLTDFFGNPVSTTAGRVSVSYDGPGIAFGTLPTRTDANGEFKFAVLLGANDNGTGTVTASYDQGGDSDFTGTLDGDEDINVTASVTVGSGSFSGTYGTVSAWTVDQGDGTAKVYVKFPTIGEKVRIGHQTGGSGSYETIYVKTTSSETMDGLRQVAGVGTYVVRTIDLESGTNRIRVDVGDDRLVQVRYND